MTTSKDGRRTAARAPAARYPRRSFHADLGSGLAVAAAQSFDVVVASLVMHYLSDWDAALSEVRRRRFPVTFWRRLLTAMAQAVTAAGFVIVRLVEPEPDRALQEINPVAYHRLRTQPASSLRLLDTFVTPYPLPYSGRSQVLLRSGDAPPDLRFS